MIYFYPVIESYKRHTYKSGVEMCSMFPRKKRVILEHVL